MTRTMADSTSYTAEPVDIQIAAFYGNGEYATAEAKVATRFPHGKYGWCQIDVNGSLPSAQMRDWEPGNYPDAESLTLETWVIDHNKASGKKDAVVYCDRADVPNVRIATGNQILGTDYFLLVSTLDGTVVAAGAEHLGSAPYTYPGVIGCQVKGAGLTGGDWDESLIYDASLWLPTPPPAPKPVLVSDAQAKAALSAGVAAFATLSVYVAQG